MKRGDTIPQLLNQTEYKNNAIKEQVIINKKHYIITQNKNNGKYILYLDNKKLGEKNSPFRF